MEQTNTTNKINESEWLMEEELTLDKNTTQSFESLPAMKFEENKITELKIDFSKPFQKWSGQSSNGKDVKKAIVPVEESNVKKNWWLNIKNPIYKELIHLGRQGLNTVKILQTGNQKNTKYIIVK